jgi:hypothetical protein
MALAPDTSTAPRSPGTDAEMLDELQRVSFDYFLHEMNPVTGLIADTNRAGAPASIAAMGLGISVYIAGIHRNVITRDDAAQRILTLLRFLDSSPQGPEPEATGYKGFYYHFLDMKTGRRAGHCELSTIDTAILMAGIMHARTYFSADGEAELRDLAEKLYCRVDWQWALNGRNTVTHGWKSESGFLPYRWDCGYNEAIILYTLAVGSPTFPIDPAGYRDWTSTFEVRTVYGTRHIYAGPLFIHQMSHIWLDFRGIHDDANRRAGIDYFENTRRATYVQREYAIRNPHGFKHYGEYVWGLTASDGPGPATRKVDAGNMEFYGYLARGAPDGPDDGTVSPWAVVASLPFAPEIVIDSIRHAIESLRLKGHNPYGFDASFNPTFPERKHNPHGWVSPWVFGLNQGPIILMIENFQSRVVWDCMRTCPFISSGLRRLGFTGGWLG